MNVTIATVLLELFTVNLLGPPKMTAGGNTFILVKIYLLLR